MEVIQLSVKIYPINFLGIASAGILIFENRQHHMIPKGHKFRIQNCAFRVLLIIFNVLIGSSVMLMAIWLRADSNELKFKFLKVQTPIEAKHLFFQISDKPMSGPFVFHSINICRGFTKKRV